MGEAHQALKDAENRHQEFLGELNLTSVLSKFPCIALISFKKICGCLKRLSRHIFLSSLVMLYSLYFQVLGGRKTWPVKLTYEETKGRAKFQSGWTDFVRDKNIKDGDVCEFVLIDSNRLVFEVRINTANRTLSPGPADIDDGDDEDDEDEDEEDSDDESIEILDHFPPHLKRKEKSPLASKIHKRMRPSSRTQKFPEGGPEVPRKRPGPVMASSGKYIALQRANGFRSANPDFRISLHSSYITGHYLYLPAKFANRYLVKQPRHAILRVASKKNLVCQRTVCCSKNHIPNWLV